MATYTKFNQFTKDLIDGVHDFDAHVFKVMLVNTAPVATNSVKANLTAISGGGYADQTTTVTTSTTTGTAKATGTDVTFTAAGGSIGPFQYAVLFNDTPTSPADPLIGFWNYGSAITLADGENFLVDLDQSAGIFTLL